jgi:uncharacterized protein (TIGR02421 family)
MMSADLDIVDRKLYLLNKNIKFGLINPINVDKEKKKLMKDRTYEPVLRYKQSTHSLFDIKRNLRLLQTDDSVLGKLLHYKRNEFLKVVHMLEHVGTPKLTPASLALHGRPSKELVKQARSLLDLEHTDTSMQYHGISSVKKFVDALLHQGLQWKVREKDMVAGAYFDSAQGVLWINSQRKFSENDLKRLVVHEIGTHIRRAENAKNKKHKLFLMGFPGYLSTEEGLAMYNEDKAGLLSNDILKMYAGRVVAIDLALQSSFSSVYNSLLEFFTKDDAFMLTMRVKRGLGVTSKPGAFTKDYLYLKGYYDMKKYVKKGGTLDRLYVGKIGIQHVPLLPHLE